MTAEEIKLLLSTPAALFLLMLLASLGSAFKQMLDARRNGASVGPKDYFITHWPETLWMLGTNAGAFITLIFTDSLNYASAIGIGYLANSAADVFTKDGRSSSLKTTPAGDAK